MVKNDIYSAGCKQTKCPLKKKNKNKKQRALENAHIPPVFRLGPAFM